MFGYGRGTAKFGYRAPFGYAPDPDPPPTEDYDSEFPPLFSKSCSLKQEQKPKVPLLEPKDDEATSKDRDIYAVVVGVPNSNTRIVQTLPHYEKANQHFFLTIDANSSNIGPPTWIDEYDLPPVHTFIWIRKFGPAQFRTSWYGDARIPKRVLEYFPAKQREISSFQLLIMGEQKKEIAVVESVHDGHIMLLGPSFRDPSPAVCSVGGLKSQDLVKVEKIHSEPFFRLKVAFRTVCLLKDFEEEKEFRTERKNDSMTLKERNIGYEEDGILFPLYNINNEELEGYHRLIRSGGKRGLLKAARGDRYVTSISMLTKEDEEMMKTHCRGVDDLSLSKALLYIRDPAVCKLRLTAHLEMKRAREHTVNCPGRLIQNRDSPPKLEISLTKAQAHRCIKAMTKASWEIGSDLTIHHPALRRSAKSSFGVKEVRDDLGMVVDRIQYHSSGCKVTLRPAARSKQHFSLFRKTDAARRLRGDFKVGPNDVDACICQALKAYMTQFLIFFERDLFNDCFGFAKKENGLTELLDYIAKEETPEEDEETKFEEMKFMVDNIELDESQAAALVLMLTNPGFISVQAPPGSGKTMIIARLIYEKYIRKKGDEHLVLTASTNIAVCNAVDRTKAYFPEVSISREHSKHNQDAISEKSRENALHEQARTMDQRFDVEDYSQARSILMKERWLDEKIKKVKKFRRALKYCDRSYDIERIKKTETLALRQFFAIGATVFMVIRHVKQYPKKAARDPETYKEGDEDNEISEEQVDEEEEEQDNEKEEGIREEDDEYEEEEEDNEDDNQEDSDSDGSTDSEKEYNEERDCPTFCPEEKRESGTVNDLVIDEASMLPSYLAVAMYMVTPGLKNVIVIGDEKQLGPHCLFKENSFIYELATISELQRVRELKRAKHAELKHIYRCHPSIVNILLKPIYGPHLVAATPPKARNLALTGSLPVAEDDSPVLFVDYGYTDCSNNRNALEKDIVVKFIKELKAKNITGEDVSIICYHKRQMASLQEELRDTGTLGPYKTPVLINTIDSYQGKEAKVVLVLTTKTWRNPSRHNQATLERMSFVSNPNRSTVAISRAQHAVYIFGQLKALVQTPFWEQFLPLIRNSGCMVNQHWEKAGHREYESLTNIQTVSAWMEYSTAYRPPHERSRRPFRNFEGW